MCLPAHRVQCLRSSVWLKFHLPAQLEHVAAFDITLEAVSAATGAVQHCITQPQARLDLMERERFVESHRSGLYIWCAESTDGA